MERDDNKKKLKNINPVVRPVVKFKMSIDFKI